MNKICIGADHAGLNLLKYIDEYLNEKGYETIVIKSDDPKDDYPDIAKQISENVINTNTKGIAICGTGIGISIACNKVKGIRASVCYDEYTVTMASKHNNLNILCFGERTEVGKDYAKVRKLIDIYLSTDFEGGKHQRRIDKIDKIGE